MDVTNVTRVLGRTKLKIKKFSPEILLVGGIMAGVTAVGLAIRQTKKVDRYLEEPKDRLEDVHDNKALGLYEDTEYKKELTLAYGNIGLGYLKVYWPVITIEAISVGCVLASFKILKGRNLALMAAYKALDDSYRRYRNRVKEVYGEEVDYEFHNDIEKEMIGTGRKKEEVLTHTPSGSEYAKFFDASCPDWRDSAEYNYAFLSGQQQYCNELLKRNGHLFLNEAYDTLGLPHTQAGAVVGWLDKPGVKTCVDFGIYRNDPLDPIDPNRRFVNGLENVILLDFNVDGIIWDKI